MIGWLATMLPLAAAEPDSGPPEAGWWQDQAVAGVGVEVISGALPDENLQPLLTASQGQPLTSEHLRTDVVTLYRVGGFSAVEAHVQPWAATADGPTVWVTYRVAQAPVLDTISVVGTGRGSLRRRAILDAAGLAEGQVFHLDVDGPVVEARVTAWLTDNGYPSATVAVTTKPSKPDALEVELHVQAGPPNLVSKVAFAGNWAHTGVTERQLLRWVSAAGVRAGRPLGPDSVRDARERIRERLGGLRRGLVRPARAFVETRVSPVVVPEKDGTHVTFSIEPRPRLEIVALGLGLFGRTSVLDALSLDHRSRLTGGFLDEAPERLDRWLRDQGWYRASVDVTLDETEAVRTLTVITDRGGRHTLGSPAPFIDVEVEFDPPVEPEQELDLTRSLMAVLDQASPDVIRREHYTDEAMEQGRNAAERFLAGRGYLEATVQVNPPHIRPRRTIANAVRRSLGQPLHQRVDPQLQVSLGPLTRTSSLNVVGAVVPLPWLDEVLDDLEGSVFSPQRADTVARLVLDAHRAAGHLDAITTVSHAEEDAQQRHSTIEVVAGPQVLLRSVVLRNRRLTRRDLVLRTAGLQLSQPIRPVRAPEGADVRDMRTLDDVRRDLLDLGVFRSVSLDVIGDGTSRDLLITLDERPRTAVEVGGGLSTDQGLRTFVRGQRINLFGSAHQLQGLVQLGLDYRSDNARNWLPDITSPEWRAAVSYTAPRFRGPNQRLTMDVTFRERRQERTLRIDRSGFGASFQAAVGPTALTAGVRLEARQLNQYDPPAVLEGEPWFTLIDATTADPSQWRTQEGLTALLLHDRRDDPIRPTRGVLLSLGAEWAPGIRWAEAPRAAFLKAEARATALVPIGPITVRVVAGAGHIRSLGDSIAPVEDRFRLGGTGSLRGFVRDGVGPHARASRNPANWPGALAPWIDFATRNDSQRWVPTGGDTLASGTVEAIVPLTTLLGAGWDGYALTAFTDVGNVWFVDPSVQLSGADALSPPVIRVGAGVGARVDTPIGPLQLDVALNPQAAFAPAGSRLAAIREAWEEPPLRLHLTLGSLF